MKNEKLSALLVALLLTGCSLNDTRDTTTTETAEALSVSNIGNNINSLGYYEGNTTFGHIQVDGESTLYAMDENGTVTNLVPMYFTYQDDNAYLWNGEAYTMWANYGVEEDGIVLHLFNGNYIDLTYISKINIACDKVTDGYSLMMMCDGI